MFILTSCLYIGAFLTLSLWFLNKNDERIRPMWGKAFLVTFLPYVGISLLVPGAANWWGLLAHVGVLFGAGFFLNSFSNSKLIFYPLLMLMTGGYVVGVMGVDKLPFLNQRTEATSSTTSASTLDHLDPNAELLLEVRNGHHHTDLDALIKRYNLEIAPAFTVADGAVTDLDDYYTANIPDNQLGQYDEIVGAFRESGLIDHIEANDILSLDPSETVSATAPSRDSRRSYKVNDPDIGNVWGYEALGIEELYALLDQKKVQPTKKARVVIIDTGVDRDHEDLNDNFVSIDPSHDNDPHGHGTHCAGIAAAVSNNAKGIASLVPNQTFVEVSSVKVFGSRGNTTQQTIINGMLTAVDQGADVLSMSLGGPATPQGFRAYRQAVQYANKKGAIVVVAAGNENIDARRRLPAAVDGVITVSALDRDLNKASFSNEVSRLKMGIAAPGHQIYSTLPSDRYDYFSGTSMATPYVAGLVGMLKAIQPELTTTQVYAILKKTGKATQQTELTGPLIQPARAVESILR